jgi:hypothetical protein
MSENLTPSAGFSADYQAVSAITTSLSWVVLGGTLIASLLLLWETLKSTPRRWFSCPVSVLMLLCSLLCSWAYLHLSMHPPASAQILLLFLPLSSPALVAGGFVLTDHYRPMRRFHRIMLAALLLLVGISLLLATLVVLQQVHSGSSLHPLNSYISPEHLFAYVMRDT